LNISGFVTLAIGTVIIIWDIFWLIVGGQNQYSMGMSHVIIDIWAIAIITIALKRILDVPIWLGNLLNIAGIAVSLPLAILFMPSPI